MLKWTLRACCCVGEPGGFKGVDSVWKDSAHDTVRLLVEGALPCTSLGCVARSAMFNSHNQNLYRTYISGCAPLNPQVIFKANNHIYKKRGISKFDHTFVRKKTHQNELEGWTPDRWALASGFGLKLMILACEHNNWLDMGCLTGKPAVHIQSTKAKYKDHSKGDAVETSSCACTRQENCTFQCSPNMRAVDCATVWVRKCLQLIYPSALHLTLFNIYSTIYIINKISIKRVCLGAMTIYQHVCWNWVAGHWQITVKSTRTSFSCWQPFLQAPCIALSYSTFMILTTTIQGLQVLHDRLWMLGSEIENPNWVLESLLFMLDSPYLEWWYANVVKKKGWLLMWKHHGFGLTVFCRLAANHPEFLGCLLCAPKFVKSLKLENSCDLTLSWSSQLQSRDFRFCMIDSECWGLKLKTQTEFWNHFYSC